MKNRLDRLAPKLENEISYNTFLDELDEDVMGFLNEIQLNFPNAISLASGRPDESFFDLELCQDYINVFVDYLADLKGVEISQVLRELGQYNRTKGIVNELIVKYLNCDYGINVKPDDTLITVGSQEGLVLTLMTLFNKDDDVLLIEDPSYIGLSHFALLAGYETSPVQIKADGICLKTLEKRILEYQEKSKKVKLVYVIPDFQNPTGTRMSVKSRLSLLELADKYNFLIIEDNAYGDFNFEGAKYPTLKSLDSNKSVIYLHSFSKIIHPSLRLGVVVTDKVLFKNRRLSDLMSKFKGYTTVNTPSLTQSILGGMLIKNSFSFQNYNRSKLKSLNAKKVSILCALEKYFRNTENCLMDKVTWNSPEGGYFLKLASPIEISKDDVIECAKNFHLIFTPMSFFYIGKGGENEIRLAYSHVEESMIEKAIGSLASFFILKFSKKTSLVTNL